jgi:CspA family cold shock protein
MADAVVLTGKVKFFYDSKGYGFLTEIETGNDYFFHFTGMLDKVTKDDKVSFELQEGQRGLKAINVKCIKI